VPPGGDGRLDAVGEGADGEHGAEHESDGFDARRAREGAREN
jgi:hypothetical protein